MGQRKQPTFPPPPSPGDMANSRPIATSPGGMPGGMGSRSGYANYGNPYGGGGGYGYGGGYGGQSQGGGGVNWGNIINGAGALAGLIGAGTSIYGAYKQGQAADRAAQPQNAYMFDPTNPILKPLIGQQVDFLKGIYGGQNPFAGMTNGLQTQAQQNMSMQLGQQSPERQALNASQGALQGLIGAQIPQTANSGGFGQLQAQQGFNPLDVGGVGFNEMQFGGGMQELRNPFAQMGQQNPAMGVVQAMQPIHDRNLQKATATLGAAAPGRFSSAFVQQGQDLASQAMQDYNLQAQQALMHGVGLQNQQQQQAMQFMLGARGLQQQQQDSMNQARIGARGLQQGAVSDWRQAQLGARGQTLQNDAQRNQFALGARGLEQQQWSAEQENLFARQQLAQQGILQGSAGLGTLAGMTGMNEFNRNAQAMQLGMSATELQQNPLLQLMLAGMNYAQPADLNTVVGAKFGGFIDPTMGGYGQPGQQWQRPPGIPPWMPWPGMPGGNGGRGGRGGPTSPGGMPGGRGQPQMPIDNLVALQYGGGPMIHPRRPRG